MKNFKDYLTESKKNYDFRVKVAGEFTTEQESKLKDLLNRYTVSEFKKKGKTPIQELPLDFPQVKNCEVNIFEFTVDYPTTSFELTEYLSSGLGLHKKYLVVRRPGEPGEEYQQPVEERKGALLTDPDYKEAPNAKFEDYYGDKYNSGFVKELNDLLKLQRKERGEEIPATEAVKYNTDSEAGKTTLLKTSPDPRK
jgi:hypothetical protein